MPEAMAVSLYGIGTAISSTSHSLCAWMNGTLSPYPVMVSSQMPTGCRKWPIA